MLFLSLYFLLSALILVGLSLNTAHNNTHTHNTYNYCYTQQLIHLIVSLLIRAIFIITDPSGIGKLLYQVIFKLFSFSFMTSQVNFLFVFVINFLNLVKIIVILLFCLIEFFILACLYVMNLLLFFVFIRFSSEWMIMANRW